MAELTLERMRQMGGQACFKKYGAEHFSKMGKLSAERKKQKKLQEVTEQPTGQPEQPQI